MAQINITLSQDEVLQVLSGNRDDAFKFLLERILNEIMKAESEEQLGASKHERSDHRTDYRNGTRERALTTRLGTLTLEVPRHRNEPFHTMVFENYKRSEAALIATLVQMVINGVSTRKVSKCVETLCGESFSKSTVSELCKSLDAVVEDFRSRPLDNMPFVMVDATYFKAREDHRIRSKAFLVALGFNQDGKSEILDFQVHDAEDNYSWINFFQGIKDRGVSAPLMIISDAHKSIVKAVGSVFPGTAWQRCQVHLRRNILDAANPKYKEGIRLELQEMFNADTIEEARRIKDRIIEDYSDVSEKAMKILEEGFEDSMTVMNFTSKQMRVALRTTNKLERINREFKRRSDVIQIFPNMASVQRLMGAVAMECNDALGIKTAVYTRHRIKRLKETGIEVKLAQIAREQQFAHAA